MISEFIATIQIKQSDWLKIRSGCSIIISSACQGLRELYTLGRFSDIFYKQDKFCDFLFAFLHTRPLLKRGLLKKERICFQGEQNAFLFKWTPFQKESNTIVIFISYPISPETPISARGPSGWYGCLNLIWGMIWKLPYYNLYVYKSH